MSATAPESALTKLAMLLAEPMTAANVVEARGLADQAVQGARANKETDLLSAQDLARGLELRGEFFRLTGDFEEAQNDYFEALSLLMSARDARDADEAIGRVSTGLAVIHDSSGDEGQAKSYYERAIAAFERMNPPAALDIADLSNNLAFIYEASGNYNKAETLLLSSLSTCYQVLGSEHEQTALLYNNVGTLYFKAGHDERAQEMHMLSLGVRTSIFGAIHPETAQSHGNLALVFVRSNELNAAKNHFNKALDGLEQDRENYKEDYETIVANFRDVLESVEDRKGLMQLDARIGGFLI
ncbi:MAG: tetratricopeptide repeat protein [Akkermansiaceae bacterium]|jgi:tetratricopeptide (TPR) repeat protein